MWALSRIRNRSGCGNMSRLILLLIFFPLFHLKVHSQVWDNFWQMMKNAFCFIFMIFKFLFWVFGLARKWLIRKVRLLINSGLELISLPHFLHDYRKKIFLLLSSINWPNFSVLLSLICKILSNMCIVILC